MKKLLLTLVILMFGFVGYVNAYSIDFAADASTSKVILGGTTTSSSWFGSGTLTAPLATLLETPFILAEGESKELDFFSLNMDGRGIFGGGFTIAATLGFSKPVVGSVTDSGSGLWGSALGKVSGGYLKWSNMPTSFTFDGGKMLIAFEEGFFTGPEAMIHATVTNNSPAPVPEPSTFLLLAGGLAGLAFIARRRKNS